MSLKGSLSMFNIGLFVFVKFEQSTILGAF
jgi:hypothetical protein